MFGKPFENITGKRASVDMLRHAKITDFLKSQRTVKEKDDLARQMAHSRQVQDLYLRVDAPEESPDEEEEEPAKPAPKKGAAPQPKSKTRNTQKKR